MAPVNKNSVTFHSEVAAAGVALGNRREALGVGEEQQRRWKK